MIVPEFLDVAQGRSLPKQPLKPFDIVSSKYVDFTGGVKSYNNSDNFEKGLFMVISIGKDNTVTCCKITSKKDSGNPENHFALKLVSHPFLQAESYVQADKLQTLYCSSCTKIGSMFDGCRRRFIRNFTLVLGQFRLALEEYANDEYTSPNNDSF